MAVVRVRERIRDLLMSRELDAVAAMAAEQRRVVGLLLSMTYEPDGLLRWRAVEGLGVATARIADHDAEFGRGVLRRLHWSLSDESGSIGWSAPEAMGEIVGRRPSLFADYAPIVASLLDTLEERYFRPGIIWAMGRIASDSPALVVHELDSLIGFLTDPEPRVRGLAAWSVGKLAEHPVTVLERMKGDNQPVLLYDEGVLQPATVGGLAGEAARAIARRCAKSVGLFSPL